MSFVMVNTMDRPNDLFEIDISVLEPYQSRLYKMISHTEPLVDTQGREFYRSALRSDVLWTVLSSAQSGDLVLVGTCKLYEAMSALQYEGVFLTTSSCTSGGREPNIQADKKLCTGLLGSSILEHLSDTHEQQMERILCDMAVAILSWPRLRIVLKYQYSNYLLHFARSDQKKTVISNQSMEGSKVWIRLLQPPDTSSRCDRIIENVFNDSFPDRVLFVVYCVGAFVEYVRKTHPSENIPDHLENYKCIPDILSKYSNHSTFTAMCDVMESYHIPDSDLTSLEMSMKRCGTAHLKRVKEDPKCQFSKDAIGHALNIIYKGIDFFSLFCKKTMGGVNLNRTQMESVF